jgi:hypothetical protein
LKQGDFLSPSLFGLALKSDKSTKMFPSGIKLGKEQLNVLEYADDMVLIKKKRNINTTAFCKIENIARNLGLHRNQGKKNIYDSGTEQQFKTK